MSKHENYPHTFAADVERHQMIVIRDDGLNRHLRFKEPGTMCMHFDLITWPGHLCYTGDMGTYVFTRIRDMFEFFRMDTVYRRQTIDYRYWAEKVLADDKHDGLRKWSHDRFAREVREFVQQQLGIQCDEDGCDDCDDEQREKRTETWEEVEDLISRAEDGEGYAWAALREFECHGLTFTEFEPSDCAEWSGRFLWCCHALQWGIGVYDASKAAQTVNAPMSSSSGSPPESPPSPQ